MPTEQEVLAQVELMRNAGVEYTPVQWQAVEEQLRQGYNPQGGLEGIPQTPEERLQGGEPYLPPTFPETPTKGEGRLPPTFGMEMPPEQFTAELETMQRADLGIPEARQRYWGEELARSHDKLLQWEGELKKKNPILFEIYRKGGHTFKERYGVLSKEIAERILTFDQWVETLKNDYPDLYEIYQEKGYDEVIKVIDQRNKEYAQFQQDVASGKIIALPDGSYIETSKFDGQPKGIQNLLLTEGFSGYLGAKAMFDLIETQLEAKLKEYSGVKEKQLLPAEVVRSEILKTLSDKDRDLYMRGLEAAKVQTALSPITGIFPPAKALLPEYAIGDVSTTEWILGGVNVALLGVGTVPGAAASLVGRAAMYALLATGTGVMSYEAVESPTLSGKIQAGIGAALYGVPLVAGPALRTVEFAKMQLKGDYVPLRSMSMEASTMRVPFTEAQLARLRVAGVSEADIIAAGTDITKQLVSGTKIAKVTLGDITIKVRNIPYETKIGGSFFCSTPDITVFDRGEAIPIGATGRELYASAKVAIEPLEKSYLTGQRATHPGIVEIRVDPELIAKIAPQQKLIFGGRQLEPEAVFANLNELLGMGYRLDPIPGRLGRGVTFDASLGTLEIRRFTLSRVVGNPTGLVQIKLGGTGNGGVVAVGDIHGIEPGAQATSLFRDVNASYREPLISGTPENPATWHWVKGADSRRTLVIMGDTIDRGNAYNLWRETWNRLYNEAKVAGDNVERLLGNHELAYLSDDAIKSVVYTDESRAVIKRGLLSDLKMGQVKAAVSAENKLFTHAGVSKTVFPEYKGKTSSYIAEDLNTKLAQAVKSGDYYDKMFAKGRVERGNSLLENEREVGGIFWLRPQESTVSQLDLGFTQVVGHNPGWAVKRIWGENFVETDVGRLSGGTGVYADTPYITTKPTSILTQPLEGKVPELSVKVLTGLKIKAMRDTVADVFLGWDGRIYELERMRSSKTATKAWLKSLDKQIVERTKAGDSIGIKYLQRQKSELLSPTGHDYLYGGTAFWRDLVMGRQNSVKVLDNLATASTSDILQAISTLGTMHNSLTQLSDKDANTLFGVNKKYMAQAFDTSRLDSNSPTYRNEVTNILRAYINIVDSGLERSVLGFLDNSEVTRRYTSSLQRDLSQTSEVPRYDISYMPVEASRGIEPRAMSTYQGIPYQGKPYTPVPYTPTPYMPQLYQTQSYPPLSVPLPYAPITPTTTETYPSPYIPPPYTPPPELPPPGVPGLSTIKKMRIPKEQVPITWKQGFNYVVIDPPYRQGNVHWKREPPAGAFIVDGAGSAYRTIQALGGDADVILTIDMGAFDVTVDKPREPGKRGTIKFKRDVRGRTASELTLRGVKAD